MCECEKKIGPSKHIILEGKKNQKRKVLVEEYYKEKRIENRFNLGYNVNNKAR